MTVSVATEGKSANLYLSYQIAWDGTLHEERKLIFKADSSCTVAKRTFSELLKEQQLDELHTPYLIAAVFSKKTPPVIYDGVHLLRALKNKFVHPETFAPIKKILFGHSMGSSVDPNQFVCIRVIRTKKALVDSERFFSFYEAGSKGSPFSITRAFLNDNPCAAIPWIDRCYQQPLTTKKTIRNVVKITDQILSIKDFIEVYSRVEQCMQRVLKADESNIFVLEKLAYLYMQGADGIEKNQLQSTGYIEKAKAAIDRYKTQTVTAENIREFIKIADVLTDEDRILGNPENAIAILERVIKFVPQQVFALYKLATIYFYGARGVPKNLKLSGELFARAIASISAELIPEFVRFGELLQEGGMDLCRKYIQQVDKDDRKYIKDAWKIYPLYCDSSTKFAAIRLSGKEEFLNKENQLHPSKILENVLSIDPFSWEAAYYLGALYFRGGHGVAINLVKAEELFKKSIAIDDSHFSPLAAIAKLYFEGGSGVRKNLKSARDYAEKAMNINNEDIGMLELLATIYVLAGKEEGRELDLATSVIDRLLALEPENTKAKGLLKMISGDGKTT